MIKPLFFLRNLSLLASAASRLAAEDPAGFLEKVGERIRTSDSPLLSKVPTGWLAVGTAKKGNSALAEARELIENGELTQGINLLESRGAEASRAEKHLAQRTRQRLTQLQEIPPAGLNGQLAAEIRVLHVLTNSQPYTHSGYTVRSQNVLQAIQGNGIAVHAVTRLAYPVLVGKIPASESQKIEGITYERMLPWIYPFSLQNRDDLAVKMIVEKARRFRATILHTTTDFKNALVTARAAAELGIPWVYEVRGELESTWLSKRPAEKQTAAEDSEFYRLAREQETRCAQAASAVVTLSEISKRQLVERGVEENKIHVVPNAIDEAYIGKSFNRAEIRTELGLPAEPLVGSVTSVVDYEGLDTLIRSLAHLPAEVRVLIVGEGTARPELQELAVALGVEERVLFVGRQPQQDIWKWYAALDVFAVPRKNIPVCRTVTPIKALMAQSLGIPVVASDLPALREVTGSFAEYVPAESPEELAAGIVRQLDAGDSAEELDPWIRTRTWRENGVRYRRIYEGLRDQESPRVYR